VAFFLALSALLFFSRFKQEQHRLITLLGWLAVVLGLTVVYCMAMIYLLPTQLAWNSSTVIVSFYVTTLLLGTMTIACLLILDLKFVEIKKADDLELHIRVSRFALVRLSLATFLVVAVNIGVIFFQIGQLSQGDVTLQTSLHLLFELYTPLFVGRLVLLGGVPLWMGYAVYRTHRLMSPPQELMATVYLSCLLILIAEIMGRFLFYATHIRLGI
jgi:anaerobic dimethyl sulfoxide reductase subunit C (anchor subunit)